MKTEIEQLMKSFDPNAGWKKNTHLCVPIKKALELLDQGTNLLTTATPEEARTELEAELNAGKEFFCGCDGQEADGSCGGHEHFDSGPPIFIGHFLARIRTKWVQQYLRDYKDYPLEVLREMESDLIDAWNRCGVGEEGARESGLVRSLNEIIDECTWEETSCARFHDLGVFCMDCKEKDEMQKMILELFKFILSLKLHLYGKS